MERRAKYLMFALDEGWVLLVHLGMSGRITVVEEGRTSGVPFHHHVEPLAGHGPHDHVLIEFEGGARLVYTDPRRFGFMDLVKEVDLSDHPRLSHLGPEPFDESWTPEVWADSLMHRKVTIKSALLDQRTLVGVGNIYACEALHRVRISPRRQARTLVSKDGRPTTRLVNLHGAVRTVLQEAIDAGGSTLRDFAAVDGSLGYFPHRFAVYDRAGESCQRKGPCPYDPSHHPARALILRMFHMPALRSAAKATPRMTAKPSRHPPTALDHPPFRGVASTQGRSTPSTPRRRRRTMHHR